MMNYGLIDWFESNRTINEKTLCIEDACVRACYLLLHQGRIQRGFKKLITTNVDGSHLEEIDESRWRQEYANQSTMVLYIPLCISEWMDQSINWIELNGIELNWIEMNWIEMNWIKWNVSESNKNPKRQLSTGSPPPFGPFRSLIYRTMTSGREFHPSMRLQYNLYSKSEVIHFLCRKFCWTRKLWGPKNILKSYLGFKG